MTEPSVPRFIVVALVFIRQEESILLVKQKYGRGYWSLPGGMMVYGESIDQAAIREVREETGLEVALDRLVGVYSRPDEEALAMTFAGTVVGGRLDLDTEEVTAAGYFHPDQLPSPVRPHLRQRIVDYWKLQPNTVWRSQ